MSENNSSKVIWHLKQIGKIKKLDKQVPCTDWKSKGLSLLKVLSFTLYNNNESISQIAMRNEKWILYNWWWPDQWLDWGEAPKHFPKPNLHQEKVMVIGGLLLVWFTTAFWILAKTLHLRSMFSKLMRCTKSCKACSQHWSTAAAHILVSVELS